ncbi:Uncharacterised protein [Providencia stuartii]|nr:hypothetical protein DR96_2318 [Providencia stuartii]SPY66237.1 Uncharacterised protein [Providencia stuartii]SUC43088.1 Uncharacterised protein [Providencia stuartii]SUC46049.1 Uncharacterised protein [Providencia stuartii]
MLKDIRARKSGIALIDSTDRIISSFLLLG